MKTQPEAMATHEKWHAYEHTPVASSSTIERWLVGTNRHAVAKICLTGDSRVDQYRAELIARAPEMADEIKQLRNALEATLALVAKGAAEHAYDNMVAGPEYAERVYQKASALLNNERPQS